MMLSAIQLLSSTDIRYHLSAQTMCLRAIFVVSLPPSTLTDLSISSEGDVITATLTASKAVDSNLWSGHYLPNQSASGKS
jgi:hypothetical protein